MEFHFQCSRKTENENGISNSVFPCRRKTVGSKVHALYTHFDAPAPGVQFPQPLVNSPQVPQVPQVPTSFTSSTGSTRSTSCTSSTGSTSSHKLHKLHRLNKFHKLHKLHKFHKFHKLHRRSILRRKRQVAPALQPVQVNAADAQNELEVISVFLSLSLLFCP